MLNRLGKIEKKTTNFAFFFFQNVDIINDSDDAIARMISQMKDAAEVRVFHMGSIKRNKVTKKKNLFCTEKS